MKEIENLKLIPAIDILDGNCVRLTQGKYDEVEKFSSDPIEMAKKWEDLGAKRIHIVDLDGAKDGKTVNKDIICKIANSVDVEIEVGGGIRTIDSIKEYVENNVDFVILGTKAFQDADFLNQSLDLFSERIILGLDLKNKKIALSGWNELIETDFDGIYEKFPKIKQVIVTDISKDGMMVGPNLNLTEEVANSFKSKIIVSGGISSVSDIKRILELRKKKKNISGAILGKSLYKGSIDLKSAIELVENNN